MRCPPLPPQPIMMEDIICSPKHVLVGGEIGSAALLVVNL